MIRSGSSAGNGNSASIKAKMRLRPSSFAAVLAVVLLDLWNPNGLWYEGRFRCANRSLLLERHTGGQIDWYSVDANGPLPIPDPLPEAETVYPGRLRYPGAPQPRWWQI